MPSRPRGLSKSKLVSFVQCPKRLWLNTFCPELADGFDAATQLRLDAGTALGDLVRTFYADGILVDEENLAEAIARTKAELGKNVPLFEATFVHETVRTILWKDKESIPPLSPSKVTPLWPLCNRHSRLVRTVYLFS